MSDPRIPPTAADENQAVIQALAVMFSDPDQVPMYVLRAAAEAAVRHVHAHIDNEVQREIDRVQRRKASLFGSAPPPPWPPRDTVTSATS